MHLSRIFIIVLAWALTACSSHESKPLKTQELFVTLIKADGSKQFNYAMIVDMPNKARPPNAGGRHRGRPDGPPGGGGHPEGGGHQGGPHPGAGNHSDVDRPAEADIEYRFNEGLIAKISDTGFCRQGYKQLDKKNRVGAIQISGQCNDQANDEDRKKFPNPTPVKVKEEIIE
ncbi:MAG TPA: hypothetical protein VN030_08400 [Cellvibrio sp.]|nr:hypothetical protein [Cellvibrio sp.]